MPDVSVILPVHNKDWLLTHVLDGIIKNSSSNVKEIIVVLDGCTDESERVASEAIQSGYNWQIIYTPDVWEVKANNEGFRRATGEYIITIQDDMIVQEPNFDQHMLKPFLVRDDLLGVTARNAQDERIINGQINCYNIAGKDVGSPRGLLQIRDIIVRGPIMFDHRKLQQLNYLNEEFVPIYGDDYDLSFRAYRKGWVVGSWMTEYRSDVPWGSCRQHSPEKAKIFWDSVAKNEKMIMERYADLINGEKHDEDISIQ
jgi:glycosyltransferase involved in cell wall biosynthesis